MLISSVAVFAFIAVINLSIISTSRIEIIKAKNFIINKQKVKNKIYDPTKKCLKMPVQIKLQKKYIFSIIQSDTSNVMNYS